MHVYSGHAAVMTLRRAWYMTELSGARSLQTRRNAAQWHTQDGKAIDHRPKRSTCDTWHCEMQNHQHAADVQITWLSAVEHAPWFETF